MTLEQELEPGEEQAEQLPNPEVNLGWVEKCAYHFYTKRREFGAVMNPEQDWEWAQLAAKNNPDRSHQPEWRGGEGDIDDLIVQKEFEHQVYLKNLKMPK